MLISAPNVSIIMATYNRAHFIKESLDYIQNQSYKNWECIIVDDGSTDNTEKIIQPYLQDFRFQYLKRSNNYKKGLPGCRNFGIESAKGDYIIFFDDDDIPHPKNLEICVETFERYNIKYCRFLRNTFKDQFSTKFKINRNLEVKLLNESYFEDIVTGKIPFNSCQVMWKKECFDKNRFNESLMYAEEWECYARILSRGVVGASINQVLYYGRKHPNSNTGEFWLGNQKRRDSKIKAVKLVIDNLIKNQLLSKTLLRYFVQIGIFLKEFSIVKYALQESDSSKVPKIKYYSLYYFYPIVGRLYRLKRTLLKNG